MADATSVHQVLMNLATNASHAMEGGGVLDIDLQPFNVRDSFARANPGLREGQHVLLSVRDTGHGMDEATKARAFEPFFSTKAPGGGSGLGLALVHGILRDHGGTAWLESAVGEGTTVSCLFPAIEAETPEELAQAKPVPRGHGERILLLDDEPTLIAVGERRLQALGYEVTTFNDPREALASFRAGAGPIRSRDDRFLDAEHGWRAVRTACQRAAPGHSNPARHRLHGRISRFDHRRRRHQQGLSKPMTLATLGETRGHAARDPVAPGPSRKTHADRRRFDAARQK